MKAINLVHCIDIRWSPQTKVITKKMKPLDIKHILEIVLRQLQAQGFRHVALAVGYVAQLTRIYLGDGSKLGLPIDYSFERTSPWARPAGWPTSS